MPGVGGAAVFPPEISLSPGPTACARDLIQKWGPCRFHQLWEVTLEWVRPTCNRTGVLMRGEGTQRQTQRGDGHVKTEAEIGAMQPQAKGAWGRQGREKAGRTLPLGLGGRVALPAPDFGRNCAGTHSCV